MAGHGGKRAGAGRKAKVGGVYETAYDFLVAVARGLEQSSPEQRVAAARAVLPYEQPKKRATKPSPRPEQLRSAEERQESDAAQDEWSRKAASIRDKHSRSNNG